MKDTHCLLPLVMRQWAARYPLPTTLCNVAVYWRRPTTHCPVLYCSVLKSTDCPCPLQCASVRKHTHCPLPTVAPHGATGCGYSFAHHRIAGGAR